MREAYPSETLKGWSRESARVGVVVRERKGQRRGPGDDAEERRSPACP